MQYKNRILHIMFALSLLLCVSLTFSPCVFSADSESTVEEIIIKNKAAQVVAAIKAKDGKRFSSIVHPRKGVRFTAFTFVDVKNDRIFSRTEAKTFWSNRKMYVWGYHDATGEPIKLTTNQYHRRYIFDRDYTRPTSININNDPNRGTTSNNAASVYPGSMRVEYFIGAKDESQMDWRALRLIFERFENSWYLVGVIHDEWTP